MRISPFCSPLVNDRHWLLTSQKETPPDFMCLQIGAHNTADEETSVYYLRMIFLPTISNITQRCIHTLAFLASSLGTSFSVGFKEKNQLIYKSMKPSNLE